MQFGEKPSTGSLFGIQNFENKGGARPLVDPKEISKVKHKPLEEKPPVVETQAKEPSEEDLRWQQNQQGIQSLRDLIDSKDPGPNATVEEKRRHNAWLERQNLAKEQE